eukprot:c49484_g1_i1 orf=32-205(+)
MKVAWRSDKPDDILMNDCYKQSTVLFSLVLGHAPEFMSKYSIKSPALCADLSSSFGL